MIGLKDCPDSQVNPIQIPEFPADFSGFSCVKSVRLTEEELPPILRKNFVPTFLPVELVWEDFWPVEKTKKNSESHFDSDPKNDSDSELKNIPNTIAKAKSKKSKTVSDSKTNSIKDVSDSLNSQKKTNPIKDVSKSTKSLNKTDDLTNPIKDFSKSTKSPNKTADLKDDGTWFMDMCFMAAFRNHFIQPELANTFFK